MSNVLQLRPTSPLGRPESLTYTVAEVAGLLDLGLGLAYALVRDGTIPAKKLGTRWVIPKAAFHTWLNSPNVDKEVS